MFLVLYDQEKRIPESENKKVCLNEKNLEECDLET